jgi:hypothetical protein
MLKPPIYEEGRNQRDKSDRNRGWTMGTYVKLIKGCTVACTVCALFGVGAGCGRDQADRSPATQTVEHAINLGLTVKGKQIVGIVTQYITVPGRMTMSAMPPQCSLKCVDASGVRVVSTLKDLKGTVQIQSSLDALNFVRFRTSTYTFMFWPGPRTVEVVTGSEEIPKFGLSDAKFGLSGPAGFVWNVGILKESDFRRFGYSMPTIRKKGDYYIIDRWLLLDDTGKGNEGVEHVRETVGADGDYHIDVLQTKDVPPSTLDKSGYYAFCFPEYL